MESKLIELLESLGYPCYEQGSLTEDNIPESFFTYWLTDSEVECFDNDDKKVLWSYWVYFYTNNPELLSITLKNARKLLKENGFIVDGLGSAVKCDIDTHSGRLLNVYYIEYL